ncbi:MAG TPA: redoxin domain-containing protein [Planctomycetaceae bacterium]|nr:redoxin domain-containing protein [Planctomycetaceae bacterium]
MSVKEFWFSFAALAALVIVVSASRADEPPTVKQSLGIVPAQSDVDYDKPDPKTFGQCKISPVTEGKATGWLVSDASGQILRRFMDNDDDGFVDQFSFYKNGLEVYRDIISKPKGKKDQFRWFNFGGTRWGLDTNADGKIDVWKQISPEEVSRIAVAALVHQDASLLTPLLISKDDLKHLGIKGPLEAKLLDSVADPAAKLKKAVANSKIITPRTTWLRFDATPPSVVPADSIKAAGDLVVYENAMALVDYGNAASPGLVHLGELIQIASSGSDRETGRIWKLTGLPIVMESNNVQLAPGLVFNEPLVATGTAPAVASGSSPKVQELIEKLQKLMENPPSPNAARPIFEKYHKDIEGTLVNLINEVKTDEEKAQWTRQLLDTIAAAVQSGTEPSGVARLKRLEAQIAKSNPKSPLAILARYRVMVAEFAVAMQEAENNDARQKIHERWLAGLEDFLDEHPKADDAPDAGLQLAMALEFAGKLDKARKWYQRVAESFATTPAGQRAAGATKRLDLEGKSLSLSGASLNGGTTDLKQLRGKLTCIVFWDTNSKLCLEDLPQLKSLYEAHHAQGFEIVGVNLDPDKTAVGAYLTQHGVKWPQIHEPGGLESAPARDFGIISLPTMFIVDAEGKVLSRSATVADLKTLLAEKLAKKQAGAVD